MFQPEETPITRLCEEEFTSDARSGSEHERSAVLLHEGIEPVTLLSPAEMDSVLNVSCSSCSDLSLVELSLAEAERKIAKLLKVKEKLVAIEVS